MQIGDPALGTFRGFEVDLLELIAERLNCGVEYRRAWWSVLMEELTSGNLDLVCSAATVTEERKKKVSFCGPHLQLQLALVVRQDASDLKNIQTPRFGVRRGTTAEEFLRARLGHQPAALSESNEELYQALSAGSLDAVIDDSPIARHFAACIEGLHYKGAFDGTTAQYAMMLAKYNNDLKQQIDAILVTLETEGVLPVLRERWFGTRAVLIA
jgi:polar amino acid transport system substrate-binding protein